MFLPSEIVHRTATWKLSLSAKHDRWWHTRKINLLLAFPEGTQRQTVHYTTVMQMTSKNFKIDLYKTTILSCTVCLWIMFSYIRRGTQAKGIWKHDPEANIWAQEGWEWRRLYNHELHNWYLSPNIIRVIKPRRLRWAGHVARMGEGRSAFKILTGTPLENRPLGRRY